MKKVILISFFIFLNFFQNPVFCQNKKIDSIITLLKEDKEDTNKVNHLNDLAYELRHSTPDTTILLGQQAIALAHAIPFANKSAKWAGEENGYGNIAVGYRLKGDYLKAKEN